jgi:esterase/lipase superfamily enzyme
MDIAIVTGETDNFLSGTTDMMRIFNESGIRNRNSVWAAPCGHDWSWWKEQIRSYIP